ncbi:ferredoxin--NADP reductase [Chitinilyticum litopenaei]|uniref:ferredoxin--NADP reductase n=1 Tax=Chitinilyticum litopenaei TaxID=1121276 RepID=UPI0004066CE6|nr:ferredoxin--NADP reductase [Chitinilyticum litopenaei]
MTQDAMEKWTLETVSMLRHWSPTMLSFRTSRSPGFRFKPGHYARLALPGPDGELIWRPYSLVSASHDDYLEFLAIQVPGGAFSAALALLQPGDVLRVDKSSFGFLTVDQLAPGKDLWLLASGTGLGPMLSILREPAVWQDFKRLVVVHSVRHVNELAYRNDIASLQDDPVLAEGGAQLRYLPIVTREPGATALAQRIPLLLQDGRLECAAGCALTVQDSRLMICGNPDMTAELRQLLAGLGFSTTRCGVRGQMAFEKYW